MTVVPLHHAAPEPDASVASRLADLKLLAKRQAQDALSQAQEAAAALLKAGVVDNDPLLNPGLGELLRRLGADLQQRAGLIEGRMR